MTKHSSIIQDFRNVRTNKEKPFRSVKNPLTSTDIIALFFKEMCNTSKLYDRLEKAFTHAVRTRYDSRSPVDDIIFLTHWAELLNTLLPLTGKDNQDKWTVNVDAYAKTFPPFYYTDVRRKNAELYK